MESHSLYELHEYIKRVVALNFPDVIWVNCEISQLKNVKGNIYLDVVEQDDQDNIVAQASAVIWYKSYLFISAKLKELSNAILSPGAHVRVKVRVDFNERYGYKLVIEDVDPSYTLGKLQMNRQKIIERLKQEEVWELNKQVPLSRVPQRLAVISSETAAGFIDFKRQLEDNDFEYAFSIELYNAAMQGQNTEREVCAAFDQIIGSQIPYDAILIIRGGGSKLDLSFFDNFNIAYKVATSPLPVIVGIGHDIDQSIVDMVANTSLKTPTACASMLVDRVSHFEAKLLELLQVISTQADDTVKRALNLVENYVTLLNYRPLEITNGQQTELKYLMNTLTSLSSSKIKSTHDALIAIEKTINACDPIQVLNKGYTIIRQENKIISSANQLISNESIEIEFKDGKIRR